MRETNSGFIIRVTDPRLLDRKNQKMWLGFTESEDWEPEYTTTTKIDEAAFFIDEYNMIEALKKWCGNRRDGVEIVRAKCTESCTIKVTRIYRNMSIPNKLPKAPIRNYVKKALVTRHGGGSRAHVSTAPRQKKVNDWEEDWGYDELEGDDMPDIFESEELEEIVTPRSCPHCKKPTLSNPCSHCKKLINY